MRGATVDAMLQAMSDAASDLVMTRAEFFAWVPPDDRRYEFDGFRPVAMTGGSINHNRISQNLWAALRARLRGTGCEALGPDAGLATIGAAVRYPDALVTCARVRGDQRLVPGVVVVFEVLSPGNSGFTDRITKMREYWAVPTIQRYVILETGGRALQMMARAPGATFWKQQHWWPKTFCLCQKSVSS